MGKIIDSGSREIEGDEQGSWYRVQVHKLDVTDNLRRDYAAAESHIVLEENSHRRIWPNIVLRRNVPQWQFNLFTPQGTAVVDRRGRATRIQISTRFMASELQSCGQKL